MKTMVMGAGVSGTAAARYFASKGFSTAISNPSPIDSKSKSLLEQHGIEVCIGPQVSTSLPPFEKLVVSPGISPCNELVVESRARGIEVLCEHEVAFENFSGDYIVVTGTNGKSTVTAMCTHLLKKAGLKALSVGNIGLPGCEALVEQPHCDVWVFEASSYQLEWYVPAHAKAVVFTSFSPDHIERHGSIERYFESKWRLFSSQEGAKFILSEEVKSLAKEKGLLETLSGDVKVIGFPASSKKPSKLSSIDLNNAHLAQAAASSLLPHSAKVDEIAPLLEDFNFLPHRFTTIGTINNQSVINDSKSTNVEATIAALRSIGKGKCILLVGGILKGGPVEGLLAYREQIETCICFGESSQPLHNALKSKVACFSFESLSSCKPYLEGRARELNVPIVFSPGGASFDEFKDFAHRGEFFCKMMEPLLDEKTP